MTPKPQLDIKHPLRKVTVDDDDWVEEEGRKITNEEFRELLKKAPVSDGHSSPLAEVMAELGLTFEDDDDED